MKNIFFFIALIITLFSCSKENNDLNLNREIAKKTSLNPQNVTEKSLSDISDNKKDTESSFYCHLNQSSKADLNQTKQNINPLSILENCEINGLTFSANSNLPNEWKSALTGAINEYNSLENTAIYFIELGENDFSADVRVGGKHADETNFPTHCTFAGANLTNGTITVNLDLQTIFNTKDCCNRAARKIRYSDRKGILLHEIGHIIGFAHTNPQLGENPEHIEGTPFSELYSVMNTNTCLIAREFSEGDILAFQTVYPPFPVCECDTSIPPGPSPSNVPYLLCTSQSQFYIDFPDYTVTYDIVNTAGNSVSLVGGKLKIEPTTVGSIQFNVNWSYCGENYTTEFSILVANC